MSAVPKAEFEANWEAFHMGRDWYLRKTPLKKVVSDDSLWESSVRLASYPWQSSDKLVNIWKSYVKLLAEKAPSVPVSHFQQYVHDLIVFDQGRNLGTYFQDVTDLKKLYSGDELLIALRALTKTFWIKDEVYVSHLMISPVKIFLDQQRYGKLGRSFEVIHINRPGFVLFGKKIEFDFSPKPWMLRLMRHFRVLRVLMPDWHKLEREIALSIRKEILGSTLSRKRLLELDNIKGYREVRYKFASQFLGKKYV
jgi:indolepyruvate ferredoxin oxidoreductase